MPSFGVSTISPKNSSSFNIFSTSGITFIKCRNCHQMKNNIRYNGNINNTSVIIFLNRHLRHFFTFLFMSLGNLRKLPAMVLAWENLQEVFVMLVVVVVFTSLEVFTFPGYFSLPPALHPGFQAREGLHQL